MPSQADRIRQFVIENLNRLASIEGEHLAIRAGDVARSMRLPRVPNICNALGGRQFQVKAELVLVERRGPFQSTTTTFVYKRISGAAPQAGPPSSASPIPTAPRMTEGGSKAEGAPLPDADLCLVSCGRRKVQNAVPAKDLYTSDRFQKTRRLVEREGWPWFILSAKHGLLDPERMTECYDMTLNNMGTAERREWAITVMDALKPRLAGVRSVIVFAGENYRKHLVPELRRRGIEVHVRSLKPGKQLKWLNDQLANPGASKTRVKVTHRTNADTDTARFYALLAQIEEKVGGRRRLAECDGGMGWPERGVYFFFEPGECRQLSGGDRVVRVGTHALKAGARSTLWKRLNQHRGRASTGIGNHRGSVFRGLVGRALARRGDCPLPPTWKRGTDDPRNRSGTTSTVARQFGMTTAQVNAGEADLERRVTAHIGRMPFLWLSVPDEPGPESARGRVERGAIGLLSHYSTPAEDPPSAHWLGHHSDRERIRESGLWNSRHVDEPYDPAFLDEMERLIAAWP